jgi:AbiV family abortive infection protein
MPAFPYLQSTGDKPRRVGPVTRDEALDGIQKCIANATQLVADATRLLDAGSPSSAGLAAIAIEELSKTELLFLTATITSSDATAWAPFWRAWTSHRLKSFAGAMMLLHLANPSPADVDKIGVRDLAADMTRIKEAAWYVDCGARGFLLPVQAFGVAHAKWMVDQAAAQVHREPNDPRQWEWAYEQLKIHGAGVRTQRDLVLAQMRIAEASGAAPQQVEIICDRLTSQSQAYLDSLIFDITPPSPVRTGV